MFVLLSLWNLSSEFWLTSIGRIYAEFDAYDVGPVTSSDTYLVVEIEWSSQDLLCRYLSIGELVGR